MSPGAGPAGGKPGEPDKMVRVSSTERDGVVAVSLAGEIDVSNVQAIESQLYGLSNKAIGLVLDMSATTFIDSSVLALLYGLRERLRRRGQMLRVVVPLGTPPRRALELAGYEQGGPLDVEPAGAEQAIRAAAGRS